MLDFSRTEAGAHLAPAVTVGDRVLLPEFGGAKVPTARETDNYDWLPDSCVVPDED
jgi:hypothetical protein